MCNLHDDDELTLSEAFKVVGVAAVISIILALLIAICHNPISRGLGFIQSTVKSVELK